jgi:hypothetical protein
MTGHEKKPEKRPLNFQHDTEQVKLRWSQIRQVPTELPVDAATPDALPSITGRPRHEALQHVRAKSLLGL